jgi:hypothetical protein
MVEFRTLFYTRPWSVLSWSCGLAAVSFLVYYGLQAAINSQIGIQFVVSEWPSPNISPYFYAKPITWFCYFGFLYWAFGLESNRARFRNLSPSIRRFLLIATAFVAFGAFYEIFFNFMLWSALEVLANNCATPPCQPDYLANAFPALRNPVNLVFATKIVTLVFGLSMYSIWFLHRVERDIENDTNLRSDSSSQRRHLELVPARTSPIIRAEDTIIRNEFPDVIQAN